MPSTRTTASGFMKFTNLVDLCLVIITIHIVCVVHALEERKIHKFYTFYPKITSTDVGGHEIYNFLCPYPTDATY